MILIAFGANLPSRFGKPEATLEAAKRELTQRGVKIVKSSKIIVTAPVPASSQPYYRNSVLQVETKIPARDLLKLLKEIERGFGRVNAERNAARVIDLDLIAYNHEVYYGEEIQVPHPRMHQREFVLGPLCEIVPGWEHPVLKKSAHELLQDLFHSLPEKVSRETAVSRHK